MLPEVTQPEDSLHSTESLDDVVLEVVGHNQIQASGLIRRRTEIQQGLARIRVPFYGYAHAPLRLRTVIV
jgi:hypothetical protein